MVGRIDFRKTSNGVCTFLVMCSISYFEFPYRTPKVRIHQNIETMLYAVRRLYSARFWVSGFTHVFSTAPPYLGNEKAEDMEEMLSRYFGLLIKLYLLAMNSSSLSSSNGLLWRSVLFCLRCPEFFIRNKWYWILEVNQCMVLLILYLNRIYLKEAW